MSANTYRIDAKKILCNGLSVALSCALVLSGTPIPALAEMLEENKKEAAEQTYEVSAVESAGQTVVEDETAGRTIAATSTEEEPAIDAADSSESTSHKVAAQVDGLSFTANDLGEELTVELDNPTNLTTSKTGEQHEDLYGVADVSLEAEAMGAEESEQELGQDMSSKDASIACGFDDSASEDVSGPDSIVSAEAEQDLLESESVVLTPQGSSVYEFSLDSINSSTRITVPTTYSSAECKFYLPSSGALSITVESDADVWPYLYRMSDMQLISSDSNGGKGVSYLTSITPFWLHKGYYVLRLNKLDSDTEYDNHDTQHWYIIKSSFSSYPVQEVESNDQKKNATSLSFGSDKSGLMNSIFAYDLDKEKTYIYNDVDWWSFSVPFKDKYTLIVKNKANLQPFFSDTEVSFSVDIFDSQNNQLVNNFLNPGESEDITFNAKSAGNYYVRVSATKAYHSTGYYTLKLMPSVSSAQVKLKKTSYVYDGKAKKPSVTVKVGGKKLKAGTDYTLKYKNNVKAGKATVTIVGKGNYTGKLTKKFTIARASISKAKVKVGTKLETGKSITVKPKVTYGGKTLKLGKDYTLKGNKQTKPGTYTLTIVGKGSCKGTKKVKYKIKPNIKLAKVGFTKAQQAKEDYQDPTVMYKGKKLRKNKDYTVEVIDVAHVYLSINVLGKGAYGGELELYAKPDGFFLD